ncbi:M-phase-specific PLK1-interacting protein [Ixodes scapularis]|uniref:M-phase-specific PLK1-interacting protein n=1 Tax=Ixodes scapularis TaxID=6945 RepID=UPI001C37F0F0|nr:M-phase-specific PLK1-interacting protein [Ixodes scapularis]
MQDDRPLFAQGVIYDSPPHSPSHGQFGGNGGAASPLASPRGHFAPNQSPGGYPRSPYPQSPRFSTPIHGNYPRPPKFPRGNRGGSPRSPWHSPGAQQWHSPGGYSGPYQQHNHSHHNRRSSGSRDSSWVSSPRSQFQSPRFGGGVDSYVKDSMVEDPWAALELQRPAKVRASRDANRPSPTGDSERPAVSATTDFASLKPAESTHLRDSESTDLQPTDGAALSPASLALSDDSKPL